MPLLTHPLIRIFSSSQHPFDVVKTTSKKNLNKMGRQNVSCISTIERGGKKIDLKVFRTRLLTA